MDKETLSNYGWVVILVLILAVLLALATPFGTFVSDAVKSTTQGLFDLNQTALNSTNIQINDVYFDNSPAKCGIEGHYVGDGRGKHGIATTNCLSGHTHTCECEHWVVPENSTYYVQVSSVAIGKFTNAKEIYNAGEELPCGYKSQYLDAFVDEDYEYRFNSYNYGGNNWGSALANDGWAVCVLDKTKTHYKDLTPYINNKPLCSMQYAFKSCTKLKSAPIIPPTVRSLTNAFTSCSSLEIAPEIPEKITSLYNTFSYCTSLTTAPIIHSKITDISRTFYGCTNLTNNIIINSNPNSYSSCFGNIDFLIQNLTLNGTSSKLDEIGLTGNNYCIICNGNCKTTH